MTSKRMQRAQANHERWLEKRGLSKNQIKLKRRRVDTFALDYKETLRVDRTGYVSAGLGGVPGLRKSIMDKLHLEPENVRKEILDKASRCAPAYNKGGYQYEGSRAPNKGGKT